MPCVFSPEQSRSFESDGYVLVRGLFDRQEVHLLVAGIEQDPQLRASLYDRNDSNGKATRMATWNHPGESVYGLAARSARVVDTMEAMLGGEVYHYHSKLTAKDPYEGGAWEWHQDYGYWYYNGCLRPDLLSIMIALDKTDRNNGCLQIATGSHRLGRIDHTPLSPTQNEVDPKRMPHILEKCPIEYCELEAGDALVFHCNAIHRSDANRSANRRWTLLICYNRVDNDTFTRVDDRFYVPLEPVDDEAIRRAGLRFATGNQEHFASKPYVPDLRKAS